MDDERDITPGKQPGPSAYSDAYYREAPASRRGCYGYSPAQCYARASEEAPPAQTKKRRSGAGAAIAAVLISCAVAAAILGSSGLLFAYRASAAGEETAPSDVLFEEYTIAAEAEDEAAIPMVRSGSDGLEPLSAEDIYTSACASTVGVTIPGHAYNVFGQAGAGAVTGTGIILSEDGYVLTNLHVIETAYSRGVDIHVITFEGEEHEAEVVGVESDSDLAVLKIDAAGLTPACLGDSEEMRVGQTIYAVGNPLGELTYTMTSGIVSALDRSITTDVNVTVDMFQIDAAVNNGNSGGPVYNEFGQVIGVVTAKYSLGGMEGLGFAIPINDACRIACDLVEKGYVSGKAYLGLTLANVSPSVAQYYDMVQGVYVYDVEEGSCAQLAGLQVGDIITAINGQTVTASSQLVQAVKQYHAGDSAELTVWREQSYLSVTVVFDEALPAGTEPPQAASSEPVNE